MPEEKHFLSDHDKVIELTAELRRTQQVEKLIHEKTLDQLERLFLEFKEYKKENCAKLDQIRDTFKKHCDDSDNNCKLCKQELEIQTDKRWQEVKDYMQKQDERIKSKTPFSTFKTVLTLGVLIIGFLATFVIANTNYISAHKIEMKQVEQHLQQSIKK